MDPSSCKVDANADIAGIGVRVAVYMQASLAIISSWCLKSDYWAREWWHLRQSSVQQATEGVAETNGGASPQPDINTCQTDHPSLLAQPRVASPSAETLSRIRSFINRIKCILAVTNVKEADRVLARTLFLTGMAIVISGLLLVSSKKFDEKMTDYHALIILNLCLINYWAGYDLLRRLGSDAYSRPSDRSWSPFRRLLFRIGQYKFDMLIFHLHSILLSILGITFWSRADLFRRYLNYNDQKCLITPKIDYWAFGEIPLTSKTLKRASLAFYYIAVIPGIGSTILELLSMIIAGCVTITVGLVLLLLAFPLGILLWIVFYAIGCEFPDISNRDYSLSSRLIAIITSLVFTAPIIYFIIATELLIQTNRGQVHYEVEQQWSYGQILALVTGCAAVINYFVQIRESSRIKRGNSQTPASSVDNKHSSLHSEAKCSDQEMTQDSSCHL